MSGAQALCVMNLVSQFGSQLLPPAKHIIWFSPLSESRHRDPFNEETVADEEAAYEESRLQAQQQQATPNIGAYRLTVDCL